MKKIVGLLIGLFILNGAVNYWIISSAHSKQGSMSRGERAYADCKESKAFFMLPVMFFKNASNNAHKECLSVAKRAVQ